MSCTEQYEQQQRFSELRAKFGSTLDDGADNKKTKNGFDTNTVAVKKSLLKLIERRYNFFL